MQKKAMKRWKAYIDDSIGSILQKRGPALRGVPTREHGHLHSATASLQKTTPLLCKIDPLEAFSKTMDLA